MKQRHGSDDNWQRWRGAAAAAAAPDPADLGTCIGLEFTLDQTPAAPPAPPMRALPGWVRRLAGKAKSGS